MASIKDRITRTTDGSSYPNVARVVSPRAPGSDTLLVDGLSGWSEDTAMHFISYRLDSAEKVVEGSVRDCIGVANKGTGNIVGFKVLLGGNDEGNKVGDIIQPGPSTLWADYLAQALLNLHNPDGTLKPESVSYEALDSTTEFVEQASSIDFNDARLFKFGKWVFRENDVIKACANRPSDNPGWLISTPLNPAVIPGSQAKGYVKQQYADIEGNFYTRIIKSGDTAAPVTYGEWMKEAKDYPDVKTAKEEDVQIGWGMILKLTRIGNTVSARIDQINEIPAGVFSPSEKIPKKYRPINNTNMLITGINSGRYAGNTMYRFAKDGSITGHSAIPGRQEWYGSATWLTDQPWEKS